MSEHNDILDPPVFDMINVKFRGDNHTITLPYCEVGNGDISGVDVKQETVHLKLKREIKIELANELTDKENTELLQLSFKDFVEVIKDMFDLKGITKLSVQLAGTYETIEIL